MDNSPGSPPRKAKGRARKVSFDTSGESPPYQPAQPQHRPSTPLRSALKNLSLGTQRSPPPAVESTSTTTAAPGYQPVNPIFNPALGFNQPFTYYTPTTPGYTQTFPSAFQTYSYGDHQTFFPVSQNFATFTPPPCPAATMGDYQNTAPINLGASFQPQVPDTSHGPMVHTYYPRNDSAGCGCAHHGHYSPAPAAVHFQATTATIAPATAPITPILTHQPPPMAQPMMMGGQSVPIGGTMHCAPAMVMGGHQSMAPGNYGIHPEPAAGIGRTPGEIMLDQIQYAHANNLYEPQDFKPADDDPSRHYFVRELDGNWTQRSRISIDTMGDCRWYITDNGVFYAVRLPH